MVREPEIKILITEPEYFDKDARSILSKRGKVIVKHLSRNELTKQIPEIDAILVRIETHLDRTMLGKAKRLRVIGSATTGLNHIDVSYARSRKIRIFNLHGTHTIPTAEHTFALILSLCRKIPWAYAALARGEWKRYRFIGTELKGRTLGIIGYGRIGSRVAVYAKAFGMKVIAYDPYVDTKEVSMVSLHTLLRNSDIVTVHATLTEQTENMIGSREFGMMKKSAFFLNTARGEIVDQHALLDALKRHRIAGAAEDVFPKEPLGSSPIERYARKANNLIITPHIAASTDIAVHEAGIEIAKEVADALGPA